MNPVIARSLAVACAVGLAIMVPGVVMGLHLGLDQAQFAAQGDTTLRAASYAFSIWGLIYLGLVVFAAYQWRRESPVIRAFGWPSAVAAAGCAGWIVTTALDWRWISVGVIALGAGAALRPLLKDQIGRTTRGRERWFVVWPNALLAGWLLLATALAIVTVATAQGLVSEGARSVWALCGIATVTVAAFAVSLRSQVAIVVAPIVWGLLAVVVAEQSRQPTIGLAAGVAAALLTGLALIMVVRTRGAAPSGTPPMSSQRQTQTSV